MKIYKMIIDPITREKHGQELVKNEDLFSRVYTLLTEDGAQVFCYKDSYNWKLTEAITGLALDSQGFKTKKEAIKGFLKVQNKVKKYRDLQIEELTKDGVFLPNKPIRQTEQMISFRLNKAKLDSYQVEHEQSIDYSLAKIAGYIN